MQELLDANQPDRRMIGSQKSFGPELAKEPKRLGAFSRFRSLRYGASRTLINHWFRSENKPTLGPTINPRDVGVRGCALSACRPLPEKCRRPCASIAPKATSGA